MEAAGFIFDKIISVTSFAWMIPDLSEKLNDEKYRNILMETLQHIEVDSSIMGISSHFMGIGRKE